ncbi:hypothetical protein RO575_18180 [Methylomonas sp. MO1]|uniref:hypothetical protein n=1 Tax=unclassified Methylomonas TaxID=2608980 RepID=UPI00047CCCEF|nr:MULTISPECIES: hypothetical protein [unclassified Methylomonas]MDT4291496.1 hypothetical protein [Methylomonas sp. MO1]
MLPKPSKKFATRYVQRLLPDYGEMLARIRKDGGWIKFQPWMYEILNNLKLTDYAKHYTIENVVVKAFIAAVYDKDEFKDLNAELERYTDEERTAFLDECITDTDSDEFDSTWDFRIPKTPEEKQEAQALFESLSEDEKQEAAKQAGCLMVLYMISVHDCIAMMVHRKKMTQLVAEAIAGDDDSLCFAAQIDPSVMRHIPYFQAREERAYREGDGNFLEKLAYRRRIPPLQSKIRFPLLYMLFATLDGMNLLDDLTGTEILDICDAAGLDRWQNRIEDVSNLNKRKTEYRRFQNHKNIYESTH